MFPPSAHTKIQLYNQGTQKIKNDFPSGKVKNKNFKN